MIREQHCGLWEPTRTQAEKQDGEGRGNWGANSNPGDGTRGVLAFARVPLRAVKAASLSAKSQRYTDATANVPPRTRGSRPGVLGSNPSCAFFPAF